MNVLVINCGSSSLKFQLIDAETENLIAKGLCERIGIEGSRLVYSPTGGEKITIQDDMPDHTKAVQMVLDALTNAEYGVVKSLDEIKTLYVQFKANGQCRQFINSLKGAKIISTESNMESYYKLGDEEGAA